MHNTSDSNSIKHTLNVIRKALEDKKEDQENSNDNALILNKLIKNDGTIEMIEDQFINKNEIINILDKKLSEVFDQKFEKWLDKNLPHYFEKHFSKKK